MKYDIVKKDSRWVAVELETPIKAHICGGSSKKEVKKKLRSLLAEKTPEEIANALATVWQGYKMNKRFRLYAGLFQNLFGKPLELYVDRVLYAVTGYKIFNLLYFDKNVLKDSAGTSCRMQVKTKYGDKALKLIMLLIK